jgi:hypothetical protein
MMKDSSSIASSLHLDYPATPKIFASLEMPQECRLSGPGHYIFAIEYSTDSKQPITIDKSRSPLSVFEGDLKTVEQLIDCRDVETGEEVAWSAFFGCGDSDPHSSFPDDEDFVEILPDKPWRFECVLYNLDHDYDTVCSVFGLEAGRKYKARIAALSPFHRWQYGRKRDLLDGSDGDGKRRWQVETDRQGKLRVEEIGEPAEFVVLK